MILIQGCVAAWTVSAISAKLNAQGMEINGLREWRHKFAPKEMVVDRHEQQIVDIESRLRILEKLQAKNEASDEHADVIREIWEFCKRTTHAAIE